MPLLCAVLYNPFQVLFSYYERTQTSLQVDCVKKREYGIDKNQISKYLPRAHGKQTQTHKMFIFNQIHLLIMGNLELKDLKFYRLTNRQCNRLYRPKPWEKVTLNEIGRAGQAHQSSGQVYLEELLF